MSSYYSGKSISANSGFSLIEFNLSIRILLSCYRLPISISLWSNCFWIASFSFNAFNLSSLPWSFSTKTCCNFFWSCSLSIDEIPIIFWLFLLLSGYEFSLDKRLKSSFLFVSILDCDYCFMLLISWKAIFLVTEVAWDLVRGRILTYLFWCMFSLSLLAIFGGIVVFWGSDDFLVLKSRRGFNIWFSVSLKTWCFRLSWSLPLTSHKRESSIKLSSYFN